jgi:membrane-associated HD superfamily phosphohydrolase
MTRHHPWARFGNDLLLGIKADIPTTSRQQEFLPAHLMNDFNHAQIITNEQRRPLVKYSRIAVPAGTQTVQEEFPLSPLTCGLILLGIGLILFITEYHKRCAYRIWDLSLMLLTGTIGIVLFLMLFSQHPTVSLNLQLLLFNPLPWFFLWPVIKGRQTRYWTITIFLVIAFLTGSLFQHYAEGLWCLALCLLLQSYIHARRIAS